MNVAPNTKDLRISPQHLDKPVKSHLIYSPQAVNDGYLRDFFIYGSEWSPAVQHLQSSTFGLGNSNLCIFSSSI